MLTKDFLNIPEMAPAFQPRDRARDPHSDSSDSCQEQQRSDSGSDLPTVRRTLPPSQPRTRSPVIFIIGPDSGPDSEPALEADSGEDLSSASDSDASDLITVIRGSLGPNRLRAVSDTTSDRPKQLTRQFLGRRLSEGGGECIRESWQQFIAEDLLNIQFRKCFGLQPNATSPFDGAWNSIDADFRESIDGPFLTRAQWLRRQLRWPTRPGSVSSPSSGWACGSASLASPQREDYDWVWCNTLPETFDDVEWDVDIMSDQGSEEDDVVGEQSVAEVARELFIQALRRLRADLAR